MASARPLCLICTAVEGKYRCPRCDAYTCSVACSREHRDNHPVTEEKPNLPADSGEDALMPLVPSDEKGPMKLSDIVDTPEYKTLLQRYPDLEKHLWSIATATDPPKSNQGNIFFKANQPWTQEAGMTNAVRFIQSIKSSPGDVRDAVREFSDLVSIFKTKVQAQDDQLRKDRAANDARIISGLLRGEKP